MARPRGSAMGVGNEEMGKFSQSRIHSLRGLKNGPPQDGYNSQFPSQKISSPDEESSVDDGAARGGKVIPPADFA